LFLEFSSQKKFCFVSSSSLLFAKVSERLVCFFLQLNISANILLESSFFYLDTSPKVRLHQFLHAPCLGLLFCSVGGGAFFFFFTFTFSTSRFVPSLHSLWFVLNVCKFYAVNSQGAGWVCQLAQEAGRSGLATR